MNRKGTTFACDNRDFLDGLNKLFFRVISILRNSESDSVIGIISHELQSCQHEVFRNILSNLLRQSVDKFNNNIEYHLRNSLTLSQLSWKNTAFGIAEQLKDTMEMKSAVQNVETFLNAYMEAIIDEASPQYVECTDGLLLARKSGRSNSVDERQNNPITRSLVSLISSEINGVGPARSTDEWQEIYVTLQQGLLSDSFETFYLTLEVYVKFLASPVHFKECLNNLAKCAQIFYKKCGNLLYSQLTCNFPDENLIRLIRVMNLFVDVLKNVPKVWVRYGEKFVESITDVFLSFLTKMMHHHSMPGKVNKLSLIDIFALLDPEAAWCQQWLHGTLGCRMLFHTHSSYTSNIIRFCVDILLSNLESCTTETFRENVCNDAKLITFTFCKNVLKYVLSHKRGQQFFPVRKSLKFYGSKDTISLEEFLIILIDFLNSAKTVSRATEFNANQVYNLLSTIIDNGVLDVVPPSVIMHVMLPVTNFHKIDFQRGCDAISCFTIKMLNLFLCYDWIRSFVFSSPFKQNNIVQRSKNICLSANVTHTAAAFHNPITIDRQFSTKSFRTPQMNSTCFIDSILNFLLNSTRAMYRNPVLLMECLNLCKRVLGSHEGILHHESVSSSVLQQYVKMCRQVAKENNPLEAITSTAVSPQCNLNFQHLFSSLRDVLISIMLTPLGAYLLNQEDRLVPELIHSAMCDLPDFRPLLSVALSYPSNGFDKGFLKLVKEMISKISCQYEDDLKFGSEHWLTTTNTSLLSLIYSFAGDLTALKCLLNCTDVHDDTSQDSSVESNDPSTLSELLSFDSLKEPWDYVGLLILRALTTNLDICLYLSNEIHFQEVLLKLQSDNVANCDDNVSCTNPVITDERSLMRHQILLSSYFIGGPGELMIPPLESQMNLEFLTTKESFHKFFTDYPPPEKYFKKNKVQSKFQTSLQKFLRDTKCGAHDMAWLSHARKAYKTSNVDIKLSVFLDLVEQIGKCWHERKIGWNRNTSAPLYPEDNIGIQMVIRYGFNCDLLQNTDQNKENLAQLIHVSNGNRASTESFECFDWFLATTFLLCGGSIEKCYSYLNSVSKFPVIKYLWLSNQDDIKCLAVFGHFLEYLSSLEMPGIFMSLKNAGISWWLICRQWLRQCFLNILDWSQIVHWLTVCFLHPPDFLLYFCLSLLKHLKKKLIMAIQKEEIWETLKFAPLQGFQVYSHISYMEKLSRKYRTFVLQHLLTN